MSAKVPVPFLRQVVPISKKVRKGRDKNLLGDRRLKRRFIFSLCFPKVARDPRFDDLSGEYNPEVFDKTYQFLNDIRAKEKQVCGLELFRSRVEGREGEAGWAWRADLRLVVGSSVLWLWSDCLLPSLQLLLR